MAIIAVFNQKGGVGKTTTALNLLAAIALRGKRPLGIDLDPQAHLSHVFGAHPKLADDSVYSFFTRQRPLSDVAQITKSGVVLCPAHLELAKLDSMLGKGVNIVTRLRLALRGCDGDRAGGTIDTSPLFNVLSLNAVFACDLVLVPVSLRFSSALRGAREVERVLNALEPVFKRRPLRRYLLTRYDARRTMRRGSGRADGDCVAGRRDLHHAHQGCVKLAESPAGLSSTCSATRREASARRTTRRLSRTS